MVLRRLRVQEATRNPRVDHNSVMNCDLFSRVRLKRELGVTNDSLFLSSSLHDSNECPFADTLSSISRNASLIPSNEHASWGRGRLRRYAPEGDLSGEDVEIALSPFLGAKPKHVGHVWVASSESPPDGTHMVESSQSFESRVVIVPSLTSHAVSYARQGWRIARSKADRPPA